MTSFLETVTEKLKRSNPDIEYILDEACKEVENIPQTEPILFRSDMVIIIRPSNPENPHLVDYNTLARYAQSSNQTVPVAYDQVVEKNCLSKKECALMIKDIDIERTKNEICNAPNEFVRESKLNSLLELTNSIQTLKEAGIDIFKY